MLAALLATLLAQEPGLADALKRIESDEFEQRENARADLERSARALGTRAEAELRARLAGAGPEGRAWIEARLALLSRAEECRRRLSVLDRLDLPDVRGREFVIFNLGHSWKTGGRREFRYAQGWLVEATDAKVRLAEADLAIHEYLRVSSLPDDWEEHKSRHPPDLPLPGRFHVLDFERFCRELAAGERGTPGIFETAILARCALELGLDDDAVDLVSLSERLLRTNRDERPFPRFLADQAALVIRTQAIRGACEGLPVSRLHEKWMTIAGLPVNRWTEEAKSLAGFYELIAASEAKRPAPGAAEWERLSASEKAERWLDQLAEVRLWEGNDDIGLPSLYVPSEPPLAKRELLRLGWKALPVMIERLDDARPTRSVTSHGRRGPEDWQLIRIGTRCRELFLEITGVSLGGSWGEAKEEARKWWAANGSAGAEGWYLKSLDAPGTARFAAVCLLNRDSARHLPRLVEAIRNGPSACRVEVLEAAAGHLGREHEALITPFLEHPDLSATLLAARTLFERCGSDRGAPFIAKRLVELQPDDDILGAASSAFGFLRHVPTPEVRRRMVQLVASSNPRLRMVALESARHFPFPEVAEAVARCLDDPGDTGWRGSEGVIRWRDFAFDTMIEMLHLRGKVRAISAPTRDEKAAGVKAWWERNRGTIDWEALQKAVPR